VRPGRGALVPHDHPLDDRARLDRVPVRQRPDGDTAYVAELASGGVALGLGCGCAAILALRCCCGSHSLLIGHAQFSRSTI
jgi:hypothetical protein